MGIVESFNLALALFSIALSVVSMWLSIHFYHRSNEIADRTIQAIAELMASVRTTEATTTQLTRRALDVLTGHFEQRVEAAEQEGRVQVAQSVGRALAEAPPHERLDAQTAAARAVTEAFSKLKSSVAPASSDYDWGPFVRRLLDLQRSNRYLSVKWLHQKVFAAEPGMQEALQIAIARAMLRTFQRTNPNDRGHPTLCCELDLSSPIVIQALADGLERGS